jgi:hypothetical protein
MRKIISFVILLFLTIMNMGESQKKLFIQKTMPTSKRACTK